MKNFIIILTLSTFLCLYDVRALKAEECEVCFKMIERIQKLRTENKIEDEDGIRKQIMQTCSETRDRKEKSFCYYIGGAEDSATSVLKQITRPMKDHYPVSKICETLKKSDSQICDLKYDKPLDWKNMNLNKKRVKELKKILSDWDESCKGCLEKQDFIDRINELKPKYVREEL